MATRDMADCTAIMRYLENGNLPYFIYRPKSLRPVKVVIRHLSGDTPAKDISSELVPLSFSVISVCQLQGGNQLVNFYLLLVTLARNEKSPEIFKLTNLSHVIIKVETYRAQAGLTQCYNWQTFRDVWANCRRPPVVYGAVAVTSIKIALRREKRCQHQSGATTVAAATRRKSYCGERYGKFRKRLRLGEYSLQGPQQQPSPSRWQSSQQQSQPKQTSSDRPEERESEQAATLTQGMSVRAPGTNGTSQDNIFTLNELCFWTLSIVWCLKNKQN
jgi:hypothetical protein